MKWVDYETRQPGRGKGTGPKMTHESLKAALRDMGLVNHEDIVRFVDCRLPKDTSEKLGGGKTHCGTWPTTIASMAGKLTDDFFRSFVKDYKAAARFAKGSGRRNGKIIIVFYCKSGYHRSVAVSTIMQHLFEVSGLPMCSMNHTCQLRWGACQDGGCEETFFSYNIPCL
jgi:rhodanese-related sulfurtransferase